MSGAQLQAIPNRKGAAAYPDSRFYTKAGLLTPYALACGYIERREFARPGGRGVWVNLWREADAYHVRAHDFDGVLQPEESCHVDGRLFWEIYPLWEGAALTKARARFFRAAREIREALAHA